MNSSNNEPHIVAGPNGSGKSTYTRLKKFKIPVLDPDAIAHQLDASDARKYALKAGREVIRLSAKYLKNGQSFARETTLAGNSSINLIRSAKLNGYMVNFHYFCLDNWKLNQKRIDKRVAEGGHGIPIEDIKRRYYRSLENFQKVFDMADVAYVFDNTTTLSPILIAT